MARDVSMGRLVGLILGALLIVIILFFIFYFGIIGKLGGVFPFFERGNMTLEWEEEYFLEHPEELTFQFKDGKIRLNFMGGLIISYRYRNATGWQWMHWINNPWTGKSSSRNWIAIESGFKREEFYKDVEKEDKKFMDSLKGKTPEEGLKLMVERTLNSRKGYLRVGFGCGDKGFSSICLTKRYENDDKELRDLDGLIHKFNRITNGLIAEGKIEVKNNG